MQIKTNGYLAGWRAAFVTIAANIVFSFGASFVNFPNNHITMLVATLALTVFSVCLALFSARKNLAGEFSDMGFKGFNPHLLTFLIFVPVASQFFLSLFTAPINMLLQFLFNFGMDTRRIAPVGVFNTVLTAVYLCILAPVSEEIIFRGVIYRYFEKYSTKAAILVSAAAFSMTHLDITSFIPIFYIGIILGLIRFQTGSLIATMISHAAVNLFALLMMFVDENILIQIPIFLICVIAFPFAINAYIRHSQFKPFHRATEKHGVSVFMIFSIIIYVIFQIITLINSLALMFVQIPEMIQDFEDDFREEYREEYERPPVPDDFTYPYEQE